MMVSPLASCLQIKGVNCTSQPPPAVPETSVQFSVEVAFLPQERRLFYRSTCKSVAQLPQVVSRNCKFQQLFDRWSYAWISLARSVTNAWENFCESLLRDKFSKIKNYGLTFDVCIRSWVIEKRMVFLPNLRGAVNENAVERNAFFWGGVLSWMDVFSQNLGWRLMGCAGVFSGFSAC